MAYLRSVEVTVGPKGEEGFVLKDLKIAFSIEKTDSSEPNESTVQIYNLSEDTSNKVTVAGNSITLKAGYRDETIGVIFYGDVVKGRRYKDGNDFCTELSVFESRTSIMCSQVSVSFAENVEAMTVVQKYLDVIGLPYKGQENIPSGSAYAHGYCFIGMAQDGLRDVLNKFGLKYTIQNNMIYIIKPGQAAENTGLKLTPKTGLLTTPQPVSDKSTDDNTKTQATNRWAFNTMLFPELSPGAACKIESRTLNGEVVIKSAKYSGDNRDGDFLIECEGVAQ